MGDEEKGSTTSIGGKTKMPLKPNLKDGIPLNVPGAPYTPLPIFSHAIDLHKLIECIDFYQFDLSNDTINKTDWNPIAILELDTSLWR